MISTQGIDPFNTAQHSKKKKLKLINDAAPHDIKEYDGQSALNLQAEESTTNDNIEKYRQLSTVTQKKKVASPQFFKEEDLEIHKNTIYLGLDINTKTTGMKTSYHHH